MLFSLRVISPTKDFGLTFEARLLFVVLMLMSKARLFLVAVFAQESKRLFVQKLKRRFFFKPHNSIPSFLVPTCSFGGKFSAQFVVDFSACRGLDTIIISGLISKTRADTSLTHEQHLTPPEKLPNLQN